MNITCEINDYSNPAQIPIRVHNAVFNGTKVELEIEGRRFTVDGEELISAIKRCMMDCFGK